MAKLTIDGKPIEFTNQKSVLQACLDSGVEIPHYCYHPGLSVPASCRICLIEVEGIPKLVPACYTPPRDGMVVHSKSTKPIANQKQVMEYLLINHPLDCPVCDKAGECLLQDYSYGYGRSQSRFEEDKVKNPKKDVGEHVLLYTDRCIMCTRCVRFTREITGTSELLVDGRGHREEIDIFPGKPLNNKLSLNVVDLCPVGALLDKSFLFQQRVWLLKRTPSVSPVDSGGENIYLDANEGVIYRTKPRYNAEVNQHWISNDTRHAYQSVHDERRLRLPETRQFGALSQTPMRQAVKAADGAMKKTATDHGHGSLFAVISPMLACEEAYLLGKLIRHYDPGAMLVLGPVPTSTQDVFKNSLTGKETFTIQSEKVPNRKGVERVMQMLGGPLTTWDDLLVATGPATDKLKAGWITGGFLSPWVSEVPAVLKGKFLVVQDALPNALTHAADVVLPCAMWAEKEGTWENYQGKLQAFVCAIDPPGAARREGDVYQKLLGSDHLYDAATIREQMGAVFASVVVPSATDLPVEPAMEFVEL